MKPKQLMIIAGEASGDALAAELVIALRDRLPSLEGLPTPDYQPLHASLEPRFFGAGGPKMAAAGVELAFDMTAHAVLGISDVIRSYAKFRRIFRHLFELALEREPDAIICVDFAGFNLRFAHAIREYVRPRRGWFHDWQPKLIQYVSPQVWASRPGRAYDIASNHELLLSILPFEREWYARHVPRLRVEFVGHPIVERYQVRTSEGPSRLNELPVVALLPGSRRQELRRHLPVIREAAQKILAARKVVFRMALPTPMLAEQAKAFDWGGLPIQIQIGQLDDALRQADVAITKSGTITLECALFGVPAVVFYKTSQFNYFLARPLVKIEHLAMPNLLQTVGQPRRSGVRSSPADRPVFPEFIQSAATGENLAGAALELLENQSRRAEVKHELAMVVTSLGPPGASLRAAEAIVQLLEPAATGNRKPQLAEQTEMAAQLAH